MAKTKDKYILVAGGGGFLGSHLCEALIADGARVTALDNFQTGRRENLRALRREPRFELVEADVVEALPRRLARQRFDEVYNLACAASPPQYQLDPEHTLLTNVLGTRHLLKVAERSDARFLLASTSEVYGDPDAHPQQESYWGNVNCTGPRACYDEGKRAAETLTFDYDRASRVDGRVARIFNTYGPRLSAQDGRVVSNVVSQALSGADITVFGDGSQTRSFCYVDDLISGLMRLMAYDKPQPGPINLGNPSEMTVRELVDLVMDMTGSPSKVIHTALPIDDPKRRRPDISKAKDLLGWEPSISLQAGLKRTIAWFESRADHKPSRVTAPAAEDLQPAA
ncbi:MAG: UDP-glucuronic acid decarboxylase family protein [Caulobacteraceae bacterium]